ncbi:ABC transporter permease [Herbidospora yilanensis]|uniref:ABC transporter permease n=1 Tax=Herbidospora yilanensis TaxID=354426 RepID=UPI0007819DC4|nr:ABC transporter permease [Herbidospora yilanensis]
MTLTGVWLRLEWRRRGRSAVVLALLIAFALATVLTAVAGARRGLSAYDRLSEATRPSTITVLPNEPGFDWDRVRALPRVEAVTTFVVGGFSLDDPVASGEVSAFPPGDDHIFEGTEEPVVLAGRLYDKTRVDEVVVTPAFARSFGRGVGDRVTLRLPTPEEARPDAGAVPFTGPRIRATVVGVIRSPWYVDPAGSGRGGLIVTPALFAAYETNFLGAGREGYVNALVRLRGGTGDIGPFKRDLAALTGRPDIDVWNNVAEGDRLRRLIAFESVCLLLFGLAALVAAVVLIGQSVARYTAAAAGSLKTLRALGLTPRQALRTLPVLPVLSAVAGAVAAVAAALAASSWTPIGTASLVEPAPGFDADWPVLGAGAALAVLLVGAGSAVTGWLALRRTRGPAARSSLVAAAARLGLPVPVVVGARFALERGRGPDALPVRPALASAVVGVLGVVAAFTFVNGVQDAGSHPERYGQNFQLVGFLGFSGQVLADPAATLRTVTADPAVTAGTTATVGVAQAGATSITLFGLHDSDRPWQPVVTEGRAPEGPGEVMLAVSSARRVGVGVGDALTLAGPRGDQGFRVVGLGFVPSGPHNDYDEGGIVTAAGYERLLPPGGFKFLFVFATVTGDPAAVMARVNAGFPEGMGLFPPEPPVQLAQMVGVEPLPLALAVFLGLLAIGAVAHALVTAVRRRRNEMAVLRACGMTPGQARGVVLTQATIVALTGIAAGVPLGFLAGRALWGVVADTMPFFHRPPLALLALLLIGPVTLLAANLLAVWPGRALTRLRVADILRAE